MANKTATHTLDWDKSIAIEGDKIVFTFSTSNVPPINSYRQYYISFYLFEASDIESISFKQSPTGLKVTPDSKDGYWDPNSNATNTFFIVLWPSETAKTFEVTFKKDAKSEIAEGGYLRMLEESSASG